MSSVAEPAVVEASRLTVRYRYQDAPVLVDLDLTLPAGQTLAIMGPSGCGKSTLLAHLAGLRTAQAGEVRLFGNAVHTLGVAALDRLRGERIGFVFQRAALLPYLTVRENIALAFAEGDTRTRNTARIDGLIDALRLQPVAGRRAAELSVGEAQRAAVARALVKDPPLLFADEPTGALDGAGVDTIATLLCDAPGRSVIVATHDARVAARCQRVLQLRDGRLEAM